MTPQQLAPWRAPGWGSCVPWVGDPEEKLTWQSPAARVSVSLPRVGGGGGGSQQTSPTSRFSTTLQGCRLLHRLKNWRFKNQVEPSHPESQRPGNQEERRKWSAFSLWPYPQWSWKTWCPIPHSCWPIRKSKRSPEMLKDKSGPHPHQALRWRERSPSWVQRLSLLPL